MPQNLGTVQGTGATLLLRSYLSQVVEDGKPPTQEAVSELFPNETKDESEERFYAALSGIILMEVASP